MSKVKGFCEICGIEIEIELCCNQFDCGCMGRPINPPVCSNECYDKLMNKIHINDKMDSNFTINSK